jgi:hypothetical protein
MKTKKLKVMMWGFAGKAKRKMTTIMLRTKAS